jgi:hypothetical protein
MSIPRSVQDGVYSRLVELQARGEAALYTVTRTNGSVVP